MNARTNYSLVAGIALLAGLSPLYARADDATDAILKRLDALEKENSKLRAQIKHIETKASQKVPPPPPLPKAASGDAAQPARDLSVPTTPSAYVVPTDSTLVPTSAYLTPTSQTKVSMKDRPVENLTWHGITLYGAIDVGYVYQTKGAPLSGADYIGLNYNMFGSKNNREGISSVTNNALSQSFVGLKVELPIAMGWTALAKLETAFNPLFGTIADICASMIRNNGRDLDQSTASADGSRCGQAINGPVYVGMSHAHYGTLTAGRQNSLVLDTLANYDPNALSYAFSLLGWSGTASGGVGSTEAARWDNSVKYVYQHGPNSCGCYVRTGFAGYRYSQPCICFQRRRDV